MSMHITHTVLSLVSLSAPTGPGTHSDDLKGTVHTWGHVVPGAGRQST